MRWLRIVLIVVAVACFAVALSYPIRYRMAQESNNSEMEKLSALRAKGREAITEATTAPEATDARPEQTAVPAGPEAGEAPGAEDAVADTKVSRAETPPGPTAAQADAEVSVQVARQGNENSVPTSAQTDAEISAPEEKGESPAADNPDAEQGGGAQAPTAAQGDQNPEPDAQKTDAEPPAPEGEGELPAADNPDAEQGGGAQAPTAVQGDQNPEPDAPKTDAEPPAPEGEGESPAADNPDGTDASADESAALPSATQTNASNPERTTEPMDEAVVPDAPMSEPTPVPEPTPAPGPTPTPGVMDLILDYPSTPEPAAKASGPTPTPEVTVEPSPTPNRRVYTGALPYPLKEKVTLDPDAMLPELKEIYALNHDLVGWISIPDTVIDYPVVQTQDSDFYLSHDFNKEENVNGQIILDTLCDPYTPSYNLIISGHHMKNGSMFGDLPKYASKSYWASHPFLEFDTLMQRKKYVIFAAFYSADYDEDEEGFRYNADIKYKLEADMWLEEVRENQLYDTEIDVAFGDEFITLTTCNRARRRDGRFVVVCRKIREGETFE